MIGEPLRANRLFWAFALCLLPFSLMLVGGERALEVLKTASLLASVPLIVIFTLMMISFLIILGRDRIKLERRADKHKEIERRSLRIVQVKDKPEDDNITKKQANVKSLSQQLFLLIMMMLFIWNWEIVKISPDSRLHLMGEPLVIYFRVV